MRDYKESHFLKRLAAIAIPIALQNAVTFAVNLDNRISRTHNAVEVGGNNVLDGTHG